MGKVQLRRSISMKPGPYAEITRLAAKTGMSRAELLEGMIHAAYQATGLADLDHKAEREAVRALRVEQARVAKEALAASSATFFSGTMSL